MSTTVQIPGGFAVLRDKLVRERDYRLLETAVIAAGPAMAKTAGTEGLTPEEAAKAVLGTPITRQDAAAMLEVRDAAIVAFLESWSLTLPLPTMDTLGDLDREVVVALGEHMKARLEQHFASMGTGFSAQPPGESPTGGSASSGTPSKDGQEPSPTPTLSPSGESTPTEAATPA